MWSQSVHALTKSTMSSSMTALFEHFAYEPARAEALKLQPKQSLDQYDEQHILYSPNHHFILWANANTGLDDTGSRYDGQLRETLPTMEQIEENDGPGPEELQRQQTLAHMAQVALCFKSRHNRISRNTNKPWTNGSGDCWEHRCMRHLAMIWLRW